MLCCLPNVSGETCEEGGRLVRVSVETLCLMDCLLHVVMVIQPAILTLEQPAVLSFST